MDRGLSAPLFAPLLGPAFARLPQALRMLHSVPQRQRYVGYAEVRRSGYPLQPLCAWLVRLQPASATLRSR
ncbi:MULTISPECIES: hypothetical protein [Xanthomonas translucens group]|uniref:Uncharacterized protein n=1 Tax=Xanthomonas cerealis pv. cerealis TaxID=152263 RepID=A0A514E993_9XANT|nr:hypothetical protein [Xanthomonas translucens]QDI02580.1 hypothetical protein E4A48_01670 [Xanthomonas translucens pv. cerealis]UKE47964.1 hypothetical protein KHA79_04640 [Xanthomonas translucens pv. cerealis]UKE70358.1 hypothetical protein K8O61_04725 [Xanthomonas translucens pv. pistacia]